MSIKTFRERSPIVIGLASILAIAAATTFAFYINEIPALKSAYEIEAEFADAAGIQAENQVRVAGIKVGTVRDVRLAGDRVVLTMEIDSDVDIPADATAAIKLATILGTKFVDVDGTGREPFMEPGDTIPLERTEVPYEIYQAANQGTDVLEDLDGPALNKMLAELTKVVRASEEELGKALRGVNDLGKGLLARNDELHSLLAGAEDLTGLLADEGDELVALMDASNEVLGSVASKREELQSLLEATKLMAGNLTALLRDNRGEIDSILAKLHRALVVLDRNVAHLDVAFEYAGPSSRLFGHVLTQGRWADIWPCALVLEGGCSN